MRFPLRLDVFAIGDFRTGDNAAPAHLAAVLALADAGYRVGVLNVCGPAAADPFRLTPGLSHAFAAGRLTRLAPGAAVDAAIAIGFDARIFRGRHFGAASVTAAHRFVTVDRPDPFDTQPPGVINRMRAIAEIALGGPCIWVPSSLPARSALAGGAPHFDVSAEDWPLVAPGGLPPRDPAIERMLPVIGLGRVARCRQWPADAAEWARHAPDLAQIAVRILGAPAGAPVGRAGRTGALELWPDQALPFGDFLTRVDYLANADKAANDPCPVEALIAAGAGAIPILEPEYRSVFSGAAVYARPDAIARTVIDLFSDHEAADDIRAVQRDLVNEVHSAKRFVRQVGQIASPRPDTAIVSVRAARPPRHVLMYSTNGVGMGHLTRQLATARRLPGDLTPVFVSHSPAVHAVRDFGHTTEFLPYHAVYGGARPHWNAGLAATLGEMIDFYDPAALVFDGNVPFLGLVDALQARPRVAAIWMRRAMWGDHRDLDALDRAGAFDAVIEPGEIAGTFDTGPTTARRHAVRAVPPVHLMDADEPLSRKEAAADLGLDPGAVNALVLPGSGNNFDTRRMADAALARLAGNLPGRAVVAEWLITADPAPWPAWVRVVRAFPLIRWIRAFDFAISAAGYNSFTELTRHGVPAIWFANDNPQMDRQDLRAAYAGQCGFGLTVSGTDTGAMRAAVGRILDPACRESLAGVARSLDQPNGAAIAARIVANLAGSTKVEIAKPREVDDEVEEDIYEAS